MRKIKYGDQFQTSYCFLKKLYIRLKQMGSTLVLTHFGRFGLGHTIKTNFTTFQTTDPDIYLILMFDKRVWNQLLHYILRMIYIFLKIIIIPNISNFIVCFVVLLEILCSISILVICCPVCYVMNFEISDSLIKSFFCMAKNSGQKYKFLKNEKSF